MKNLREAHKNGTPIEFKYNERTIGYEPDLPMSEGYSAMTISPHQLDPVTLKPLGESGWHFGPRAFTSEIELRKTILQELHRLNFSDVVKKGGAEIGSAKNSTKNAFQFAEDGWKLID